MTIDQLKEAARKATPGPWEAKRDECHFGSLSSVVGGKHTGVGKFQLYRQLMIEVGGQSTGDEQESNTRYIAAASPDVILDLIRQLEIATRALQNAILDGIDNGIEMDSFSGYITVAERELLPAPPNESPEEKTDGRT